jgi:PAS domain S-box-containing protein
MSPEQALSQDGELAFRARYQRLSIGLDAANVGTWDWNIRTGEVRWSDNLERIHGQEKGAFRGTFEGFLDGVHPDDRQGVLSAINRAIATGGRYEIEYRSLRADGVAMWLEGRGGVFRDAAGEPIWMSGICMDTTERHQLQDRLRQSQRLEGLGVLAGGVAHDFNNLLTSILGNASLAETKLGEDDPTGVLVRNVVTAARRAADLTQQLLTYAGKAHVQHENLDLGELVREILPLVQPFIPSGVELQLDLAAAPIRGDAGQIHQLVMNLIINAAEAISGAGTIAVNTGIEEIRNTTANKLEPGKYAVLRVRDTGCGMDEATLGRIFDPFFSTKFPGRGLGLAAVHGIVKTHLGIINANSIVGDGTTFTILLPAGELCPQDVRPAVATVRLPASGAILVVDDQQMVLQLVRAVLESDGYTVLQAPDGQSALDVMAVSGDRISAVILDMTMPGMSSEDTLRHLRAMRPGIRVIIASGYGESEIMRRFEGAGISGFLRKPFTAEQLVGCIAFAVRT